VRISGSNAGYTMFRGSVKGTGYPLHSPVFHSLPPPVRHHFSTALYRKRTACRHFLRDLPSCVNPVFRRALLATSSPQTVVSTYETDGETMAVTRSLVMSEGAVYIPYRLALPITDVRRVPKMADSRI